MNAVVPGPVWTPLQEADGDTKKLGESTCFKWPAQPVELATAYVLLASQESSYTMGEIYGVTGGMGVVSESCLGICFEGSTLSPRYSEGGEQYASRLGEGRGDHQRGVAI